MKKYVKRYIDSWLEKFANGSVMLVIDGVKGCGKTEAAKNIAKSKILIDTTEETKTMLANDPEIVLYGEKPRLIDEWQLQPWIWNKVRHAIDDDKGCYVLTGSSTPNNDEARHSGAGRAVRYKLRPMSWHELGWSTGEISMEHILQNKVNTTKLSKLTTEEKLQRLKLGGWPFLINKNLEMQEALLKEYVESIYNDNLLRINGIFKDSKLGHNLLKSLSRNISTCVSFESIRKDMKIHDTEISQPSIYLYYNALERIHIIEDLPAWSTHLRSTSTLRKVAKRYFVDPSIAIACLNISIDKLKQDPNYIGFIFENEVVKNLRIYGEQLGATLYYFGENFRTTRTGKKITLAREVDIIMEFNDGNWAAFEVKYGFNDASIASAVSDLNRLMKIVDFNKVKKPLSLNIITCDGYAYKRKEDGINVIPLNVLRGKI